MDQVFLSYSRQDAEAVRPIIDALLEVGINLWCDEGGIETGDVFSEEILRALEASSALIALWSRSSRDAKWVHAEVNHATELGLVTVHVTLDGELPFRFGNLQAVKLLGWKQDPSSPEISQISSSIRNAIGRRRARQAPAEVPEERRRGVPHRTTARGRPAPIIFLAEPSPDLRTACARLANTLEGYGVRILTSGATRSSDRETAQREAELRLAEATLSVHLIGSEAGEPFESKPREPTLSELHFEVAVRATLGEGTPPGSRVARGAHRVLAWVPDPVLRAGHVNRHHSHFLDRVRSQDGHELLHQGLETLVDVCLARLEIEHPAAGWDPTATETNVLVFSREGPSDDDDLTKLLYMLQAEGLGVTHRIGEKLPPSALYYEGVVILHMGSDAETSWAESEWAARAYQDAIELTWRRPAIGATVFSSTGYQPRSPSIRVPAVDLGHGLDPQHVRTFLERIRAT